METETIIIAAVAFVGVTTWLCLLGGLAFWLHHLMQQRPKSTRPGKPQKQDSRKRRVPPGNYPMCLTDVETFNHPEFGARWRWVFTVVSGTHGGKRVNRFTTRSTDPRSNASLLFLRPILGRDLLPGEVFDPKTVLLTRGYGTVDEIGPKGKHTQVVHFEPVTSAQVTTAAEQHANGEDLVDISNEL